MLEKIKSIKNLQVYIISLIVIILDRITKLLVVTNMLEGNEIIIIPNFFSIFYVKNLGAALSTFRNKTTFLILTGVFCIALLVNVINKEESKNKTKISLGIILGGMIGNLIDRVSYKYVIDFLAFTISSYKAPVFNIADIGITCGVALYLILSIIEDVNVKKRRN